MSIFLLSTTALISAASPALAEGGKPPITAQTARSGGPLDPDQAKLTLDTVDLAIEVFPDREAIAGVVTLNLIAKAAVTRLPIDLDRNLVVSAVSIDGRPLRSGAWSNPQGRLMITPPGRIAAGTRFALRIAYAGTPHVAVRAPWDGGFVWAKTKDGQPWVATAVQGEGCDLFWPCIDHPTFEPKRADLHITVPKGLKAPSNGVLGGVDTLPDGRTTWNWSVKDPTPYGISLNIAPYELMEATYKSRFGNSFPMQYWYLPGDKAKAEALFAEFPSALDFFESSVGPYPWGDQKMGVVNTPHLGMEHQTINAYGNAYRKAPEGYDWLFHHEFAHEWFANQLTNADWDDMWLHEGYGQYMQPLYLRWRDGEARYNAMMLTSRNGIQNRFPVVSGKPKVEFEVYKEGVGPGGDIYSKGAWVLHTLRNLIGDKPFYEVTTRMVYGRPDPSPGNFGPRLGTTPEYVALVNQVTGADYRWFFDVYLYEAALPELVETRRGNSLSLSWKTPRAAPFPLPVEVEIDGKLTRLAMTGGRDTLTVPESAHVVIDPMARILRRSVAIEQAQAQAQQAAARPAR
jgi:aminopeptidase N